MAYADVALAGGRADDALLALRAVAPDEPLHEGLQARLMLALAGSGEQAAALQTFLAVKARLDDELGIGPGPELASAYLRVLRHAPVPGPTTAPGPPADPAPGTPADPTSGRPTDPGRSIESSRELGLAFTSAAALSNRGYVDLQLGRLSEAVSQFVEAIRILEAGGYRDGAAQVRGNLGEAAYLLGRLDFALELLTAVLAAHRASGNRAEESVTLRSLADVLRDAGRLAEALTVSQLSVTLAVETSHRRNEARAYSALASVRVALGEHREAIADFERALRLARATRHLHPEVEALIGLADARLRGGERTAAQTYATSALGIARSAGFRLLEAQAATALAEVYAAGERDGDAVALAEERGRAARGVRSSARCGPARALLSRLRPDKVFEPAESRARLPSGLVDNGPQPGGEYS